MGTVLRIAWRDLWRNRRRTLVNLCAVGLGLFLVIVYTGLIGGMIDDAKNQLDSVGMGHVEVTAPGWRARHLVHRSLDSPPALVAGLELPPGAEASWRVVSRALASSARGSHGVLLQGIDPRAEAAVASYATDVRRGARLEPGDDRGVLVGERLAEDLHLAVGQKLRVMAQRADGEVGADLFRVRGIFHAAAASVSKGQVLVTAAAAQRLLGLGDGGHQIVIQLPRAQDADAVAASVRAQLGDGAEVSTWGDLLPLLKVYEGLVDALLAVLALFIYLLVALGILNTMLMSVLERTREFGILRAIGTRPGRVVGLVMGEAFWIATLGVALGLAGGLAATYVGATRPIVDFSANVGETIEFAGAALKSALLTKFSLADGLRSALLVYVATLLTALYPAWRVSRIQPAQAIHSV